MGKMKKIKILFMGTPEFSSNILQKLLDENYNVIAVITQPDKKIGRKQAIIFSPTKKLAIENNIKVYQPVSIKNEENMIDEIKPELIITAAYGQIIPEYVLKYPEFGSVNVHGSLLPRYRGGAPLQYALLNGDSVTGITIMEMINKMDAGDIISQSTVKIDENMTFGELYPQMIEVAKTLLIKTLPLIISKKYERIVQDENKVVFSPIIKKGDEKINWNRSGEEIHNQIRALDPEPGAYGIINEKRIKLFGSELLKKEGDNSIKNIIVNITKKGIEINCQGKYNLLIKEFQIEGKKKKKINSLLNLTNKLLKIGNEFK